jgi:outer membrane protein assembly factor BamB/predicted Ser/Thr protein kinase
VQTEQPERSADARVGAGSGRTTLQKGTVLHSRYQVTQVVGLGGMSTVYAARDMVFSNTFKPCAIKEMTDTSQGLQDRAHLLQTFEREANLLAGLSHPAVPKVYDYFTQGEQVYLVMEFIKGNDLETVLNASEDFIPQDSVLAYAVQIVDVLAYLHNHKPLPILFRDLKPSNVMLTDQERIVLIDFGIAKAFQSKSKGTMIGTEGYCPPEQYRGMSEPRGDLYSLGAMMHHMLTRIDPRLEAPFTFAERPPTKVNPAVTKQVEALILRAIAYLPEDRFSSAEEMRDAIESCLTRPRVGTHLIAGAASVPAGGPQLGDGQARLRWKFTAEDEIRSTPLVHNDTVFVGTYDQNLYALDPQSGALRWKFATEGGICSTPAGIGDLVIFGSEDNNVYALDIAQHAVRWLFTTQSRVRSSPRLTGYLYAIDLNSGNEIWRYKTWKPIRSTPFAFGTMVYIGSEDHSIYGVEASTGLMKWKFQTMREITSSPIVVDKYVYIGSMDGHLYCFDAELGWQIWRYKTGHYILGAPRLQHGLVYVGSTDQNLYAVDLKSGRLSWKFQAGGQISSTPVVAGDLVFFTCIDQNLYCVNARTGKLAWRFRAGGMIPGSPVVHDRTVYFGATDGALYAVSVD